MSRYDVPAPRYTSYPTVPAWSPAFRDADHGRALARAAESVSLYLHLPFCRERCLFCGCNVAIAKRSERADPYLDRVAEELEMVARALGPRRTLASMHWGGGTPTFLDEQQLARAFAAVEERFDLADELSIEIDPRVTSVGQLELLRTLGFNRLSMGVQDFDPQVQAAIGREQPMEQTERLLSAARRLSYSSVNFDLIYGLPHQTTDTWARTLDCVIALGPDRIATFAMAYVPDLKPHQRRLPVLPAGEEKLRLFEQAVRALTKAGYRYIGMDHFARDSDELAKAAAEKRLRRNFQGYTTERAEVIGVGASAISDVGGAYAQNEVSLAKYYRAIDEGRLPTQRGLRRTEDDERRGGIIADLMCNLTCDFGPGFEREREELGRMAADGLVELDANVVRVTERGRRLVRNVAMVFDAYLDPAATHAKAV